MMSVEFTEREQDVLRLLATGQSNREIAQQLVMSVETVHWYNKQLYSKLDVHNRRDAVRKAQELGFDSGTIGQIEVIHNLPESPTAFVGRLQEKEELKALVTDDSNRLITILGQGGMGKTRLVLAVAGELIGVPFPHGVFFVPLQALASPDHIMSSIGQHIGYQFQSDNRSPQQQIIDYLQNKQILLILDNFEHLLAGATLVSDLLKATSRLTVLVTSRERLNLYGEMTYNISGLRYSDSADAKESDAEQLFIDSVRNLRPQWQTDENELKAIGEICSLLQGMPLGIELAAGWMNVLSVQEIVREISQSTDLLQSSLRDIPERHRSIRAMLDGTWQKLNEEQQSVFTRLAVFRGGFTKEALRSIMDVSILTLQTLLDRALIQQKPDERFEIHELLRQYAEEKLTHSQTYEETRIKHYHYYTHQFVPEREIDIKGRSQLSGLGQMERDFDNVRAAWEWAVQTRDEEALDTMLEGIKLFCEMRNRYEDRHQFFVTTRKQLFERADSSENVLFNRLTIRQPGYIAHQPEMLPVLMNCLDFARQQDDKNEIAYCLYAIAFANHRTRNFHEAIELYEESLALYKSSGDEFYISYVLRHLCDAHLWLFDLKTIHFGEQCLEYGRRCGNHFDVAWTLNLLAIAVTASNDYIQGIQYYQDAIVIWQKLENRDGLAFALFSCAINLLTFNMAEAKEYTRQALRIGQRINKQLTIAAATSVFGMIAVLEGHYQEGLHLCQDTLIPLERQPHMKLGSYAGIVMAAVGLKDFAMAKDYINKMTRYTIQWSSIFKITTIALSAFVYASQSKSEYAVELLGLCKHGSGVIALAYVETWSPFIQLHVTLKDELGEEAYLAAFERGKSLDLETVIQQLLDEFSTE